DRGPNADAPNGGVLFPLPAFTPTAASVHLDATNIVIDSVLPFLDSNASPVTGIPNDTNCDTPYLNAASNVPLPYNQEGLDTEDIRRLPNGDLAFAEEYSPSVGIIDGVTGKVKVRYVPAGVSLPNAAYLVKPILPAIFTKRRLNKGFEGLALSPDGH